MALVRFEFGVEENGVLTPITLVSLIEISPKKRGRLKPTKSKQNNRKYKETNGTTKADGKSKEQMANILPIFFIFIFITSVDE
jgi:hypothetical protein